ncbi:MAG: metallophosphoesterase [Myxococcota bacterium]
MRRCTFVRPELALLLLWACARAPVAEPPPSLELDVLVEAERARFVREVQVESENPSFPPRGPRLLGESEASAVYTFESFVSRRRRDPPPGTPIQVHNLVVREAPRGLIQPDGTLRVEWSTDRPLLGGRIDYGLRLEGTRSPRRVFRKVAGIRVDEAGNGQAHFDFRSLLGPRYDLGAVGRGRGILAIRLRLFDAEIQVERWEDFDLSFRCQGPCRPDAELVQLPSFLLGPVVDQVSREGGVVTVETDVPTRARVVVLGDPIRRFDGSGTDRRHEIRLGGLEAGIAHPYFVLVQDGRKETSEASGGQIRTMGSGAFRFGVMSDSRAGIGGPSARYRGSNAGALERLGAQVLQREHSLVLFVGDLINGYTTEPGAFRHELEGFVQAVQPVAARVPFYEVVGNHELLMDAWSSGYMVNKRGSTSTESVFAEVFTNPDNGPGPADGPSLSETAYSFDWGTAHFAVVNSNYDFRSNMEDEQHPAYGEGVREGWVNDVQIEWLDKDLAEARVRGQKQLFVFTHEPAYPSAGHVRDAMFWGGRFPEVLERRDLFWSILVKHRVLAAFFGDEHAYTRSLIDQRVDPRWDHAIHQIVSGGAGAPYYALDRSVPWIDAVQAFEPDTHLCEVEVDGRQVILRAINDRGEIIDRVQLAP